MVSMEHICLINVDSYRCNGCESCVSLCPELFRINDASGKAEAINDSAPCSEQLNRAAATCPVDCIEITPRNPPD